MFGFGIVEFLIILVIVVLFFGVGRISKVAGEMGKGIRSFKNGLQGDKQEKEAQNTGDEAGETK